MSVCPAHYLEYLHVPHVFLLHMDDEIIPVWINNCYIIDWRSIIQYHSALRVRSNIQLNLNCQTPVAKLKTPPPPTFHR